jgi:FtsZ-binding cell division protein ZapB
MAALDDSQVQELADTITELQKEILSLRDIIASKRWDATDMEQEDILDTVKELRTQIEILEEDNKTLRISRDTHQQRCAELIRINKSLQHRAKKAA